MPAASPSWNLFLGVFAQDREVSHVESGWRNTDHINAIKMRLHCFKKAELNRQLDYI